ncbi:MAG: DUF3857 domain-containing protein [Cytophagales bacterium]|nr:MAG: DUF3857 domain-containing protein [Cytophagales bacterium]
MFTLFLKKTKLCILFTLGILHLNYAQKQPDAVLQSYDQEIQIINELQFTKKEKWVYIVLNPKGKYVGDFEAGYDKTFMQIVQLSAQIQDAQGNLIKSYKKDDFGDVAYQTGGAFVGDYRYKYISLQHTQYPYTITFELTRNYSTLLYLPTWYPQIYRDVPTESSSFIVQTPNTIPIEYNEIIRQLPNAQQESATESKERIFQWKKTEEVLPNNLQRYVWQVNHIPAQKDEYWIPSNQRDYIRVQVRSRIFGYGGFQNVKVENWQDLGSFFYQLNEGRQDISLDLQNHVRSITANANTEIDKIKTVYEYMQSRTRYVGIQLGIGGYQTMPASEVEQKGYGDCKALTNYTQTLLKAIGINAYYTLVYGGDNYDVPNMKYDFPNNAVFNHVILCVPLQNQKDTLWLECTSQNETCGYLSDFTNDRNVLIITPQGGKIAKTKSYDQKQNIRTRKADIQIEADGSIQAQIKGYYQALQQYGRENLIDKTPDEQKKWLYENLDIGNAFTINEVKLVKNKNIIPSIEELLQIKVSKYASISGNRLFLVPNLLSKIKSINSSMDLERVNDFYFDDSNDYIKTDTLFYTLPPNYQIEYKPEDVKIENEFGKYYRKIEFNNNQIVYIRQLSFNKGYYSQDKYKILYEMFKNIEKFDKEKIVFINKP